MFEGSLIESCGLGVSRPQRWTALSSITLQCAVAALLLAIPLFRPQSLPTVLSAPKLVVPMPPPRHPVPLAQPQPTHSRSPGISAPARATPIAIQPLFAHLGTQIIDDAPAITPSLTMTPAGAAIALGLGSPSTQPVVSVVPTRPAGRAVLSSGVVTGMLLAPIQPNYPPIAKAAGIQGTVVVEAVISKTGRIESLHVLSGPPMLRGSALDAISVARYQPYKLDGEPTEVQTTITVIFRLGAEGK
jgi:protein TonB